jgi:superfamily I DNA/RNA helicase
MKHKPSKYQEAIYHFVRQEKGNAFIEAVAGSGKTTTLVEVANIIRKEKGVIPTFLAFNKDIVTELQTRVGNDVAKTLNSLGNTALWNHFGRQRVIVEGKKYSDLIQAHLENMGIERRNSKFFETTRNISTILSFCQSYLVDASDVDGIWELINTHNLDMPSLISDKQVFDIICKSLNQGETMALKNRIISFDDQIWLPILWGIKIPKSKFVLVDEAQDLSKAKLELALSSVSDDGRIIFVGDSRQAIYGFAGADTKSVKNIIERTDAKVFPLSVTYRCPSLIVELAKHIVPSIEPRENAPAGVVRNIVDSELSGELKSGDLVLCRLTNPLISLCIKLIAQKIPAKVKGRNIGDNLVKLAKDALGKGAWSNFPELLEKYSHKQMEKIKTQKNNEVLAQALEDKIAGVRTCYYAFQTNTIQEFAEHVNNLFSDHDSIITLSTIHKAKGLEYPRVFIIRPDKLPLKWKGQTEEQRQQEMNLKYVAITRAQEELVWVTNTEKD